MVDRFLAVLACACDLFPKVGRSSAVTVHAVSARRAYIHIAVNTRHVIGCHLVTRGTCQSMMASKRMVKAIAPADISCRWSNPTMVRLAAIRVNGLVCACTGQMKACGQLKWRKPCKCHVLRNLQAVCEIGAGYFESAALTKMAAFVSRCCRCARTSMM